MFLSSNNSVISCNTVVIFRIEFIPSFRYNRHWLVINLYDMYQTILYYHFKHLQNILKLLYLIESVRLNTLGVNKFRQRTMLMLIVNRIGTLVIQIYYLNTDFTLIIEIISTHNMYLSIMGFNLIR